MNTLIDTPASASHENGLIVVTMASGDTLRFPCSDYPRLANATRNQLGEIELSPFGLHSPQPDEDLSIRVLRLNQPNHPQANSRQSSTSPE